MQQLSGRQEEYVEYFHVDVCKIYISTTYVVSVRKGFLFLLVFTMGCHYANTSVQYTAIFHDCKNVNFQMIF